MADIGLIERDGFFDIAIENGDLVTDFSLASSVILTLFSNARATTERTNLEIPEDPRGWFADDNVGSLLWLFSRQAITETLLVDIENECARALQYLVDEGRAESIDITATRGREQDTVNLRIEIVRDDNEVEEMNFQLTGEQ